MHCESKAVLVSVCVCRKMSVFGHFWWIVLHLRGHFWWIVNPAPVEPGVCGLAVSKQHGVSKLCLPMSVCREMSIFVHFWWIILHLHTTIDTVRGLAVSKQCAQQAKSVLISVNVCRKTWCLTSTETIRFIRDGTTHPPPTV